MAVSVTVLNGDRAAQRIQRRSNDTITAITEAVNRAAQEIFAESQRRVPVDTGNLRASARVQPAREAPPRATITYGGTAAEYALAVHETHRSQSKYLEEPAREHARQLADAVGISIKRVS